MNDISDEGHSQPVVQIHKRDSGEILYVVPGHSLVSSDLRGLPLSEAELGGADLTGSFLFDAQLINARMTGARLANAQLGNAVLFGADLRNADLTNAQLYQTILSSADLSGANLTDAFLGFTDLTGTNFSNAKMNRTDLCGAFLYDVNFEGADLADAVIGVSTFVGCENLHRARGLDRIRYNGPCALDVRTLRACLPHLSDEFMLGVGYTPFEIQHLRDIHRAGIATHSVFISHGSCDEMFVDRLRADLVQHGIPCWHYKFDATTGRRRAEEIGEQILLRDKLLVVLSKESVIRKPVVDEILRAIDLERETGEQKLFPIRLDDYVLGDEMRSYHDQMVAEGEWRRDWLDRVRSYWIGDFTQWRQEGEYQRKLDGLLDALRKSTHGLQLPESSPGSMSV